jgi:hypothetical protein
MGGCGLVLASALAFGGTAVAEPSVQMVSGNTSVRLSTDLLDALTSLGVEPGVVLPGGLYASGSGVRARFPIPTGEVDVAGPKLEVIHSGGLTLTAGSTRVALTSFIIENINESGDLILTGVVKANDTIVARIPLFDITLTQAPELTPGTGGAADRLAVQQAEVTLTEVAADTLNSAFGLDGVFTAGFPIGTAYISARVRDLDG